MPLIQPHPDRGKIMEAYKAHAQMREPSSRGLLSNAFEPIRKEFKVFGFKGGSSNLFKRAVRFTPLIGATASLLVGEPKSVETARWKTMHAVERWKEMQEKARSPREWAPRVMRAMPEEHSRIIQFNPGQAERFRTLVKREPLKANPFIEERLRKRQAAFERRERRVA